MAVDSTESEAEVSGDEVADSSSSMGVRVPRPPRPPRRSVATGSIPLPAISTRGAAASAGVGIDFPARKPPGVVTPRESVPGAPSGTVRARAPMPSHKAPPGPLLDSGPPASASILEAPTLASEDESAVEAMRAAATAQEERASQAEQARRASDQSTPAAAPDEGGGEAGEVDEYAKTSTMVIGHAAWASSSEPASPIVEADDDDREDTTVGDVPKSLLALSGGGDDETRAYTAPAELIALAKRQREERRLARETGSSKPGATGAPPAADAVEDRATAPAPQPSVHPLEHHDSAPSVAADSAPPVPRTAAEQYGAVLDGAPLLSSKESEAAMSSAVQLARKTSDSERVAREAQEAPSSLTPAFEPPVSAMPPTLSRFKTPWLTGVRRWLLVAGVMAVLGYVAARVLLT